MAAAQRHADPHVQLQPDHRLAHQRHQPGNRHGELHLPRRRVAGLQDRRQEPADHVTPMTNYGRLTQASTNNPYGQPIPDSSYTYYYDSNPLDSTYPPYPPNYGWGRPPTAVAWTSKQHGE